MADYMVLKNEDVCKYLSTQELGVLDSLYKKVEFGRCKDGKEDLNCVVLENEFDFLSLPSYYPKL